MNIESRKIKFVQEFLKLQNEKAISKLEKLLNKEKEELNGISHSPFEQEGLNNRIEISELDFKKGMFKSSDELLEKFQ
ncbi:hypothetical protein [Aquiflexum lacus]|uniref:hypothetical protein n=1 Tax=Aquiflexum lacus TaxID=2483805 RepID=UPI0018934AA1|nr:hypothetical protein [Aquiflexum lacus]